MDDREHQALQRRSHELSILNDVARALNASVDLPALLARALEKVAELLGLSTGWVLLFDETSGEPYLAAAQDLPPGLREEPLFMAGWCYCLESFRDGEFDDAANVGVVYCSRLRKLALAKGKTAGLRYHASVPLQVYDDEGGLRRLGMLNVAGPEWRELEEDELSLLHTIGDMLSVAVERARLHARRLESAQIEERNRLAREIHDTIAQDLSAIAFQLEAAEALLSQQAEPERVRRSVTAALDLTRKGLEEARRSVLDLRAAPLEGRTLPAALAPTPRPPRSPLAGCASAPSAGSRFWDRPPPWAGSPGSRPACRRAAGRAGSRSGCRHPCRRSSSGSSARRRTRTSR